MGTKQKVNEIREKEEMDGISLKREGQHCQELIKFEIEKSSYLYLI